VSSAGTYTFRSTTANGCFATDAAVVTKDVAAPLVSAGEDKALSCDTRTAQLNGSSTTGGVTYSWVASNGGHIVSGANTASPIVDAAGTYTLTVTNPANGCTATDVALVTAPVCETYCSYTQGFYSNKNGLAMLPSLLTTPITIGRSGKSFTIPANTAMVNSAAKLNSILPGGSTPDVLKAGDCSMMESCLGQYLTKQGKINNVMLSQTITLTLNTRLKGGILASFPIKSGYIVTPGGSCTQLNSSVVNYLTANGTKTATVSDLLTLANDVLGGTKTAGSGGVPSLSNITSVIDAFNNVFDGCKSFSGYFPTCPYTTTVKTVFRSVDEQAGIPEALKISTYPNPFRDRIRFVIESPVSGKASLEVFNILGQKVQTVFQGQVTAGISQIVEYSVPPASQGNLMYTLNMNGKRVTGKLMYIKQ
ncbi:MAG: T9SS type A sorting domain-containing protein, partial [Sphingobacteriales bacterium]